MRDGKTVSDTLPELITALQWKVSQKDGEVPLLLVGLLDGQLVLAEVLRANVNLVKALVPAFNSSLIPGAPRASEMRLL